MLTVHELCCPKRGHRAEECEDAFQADVERRRFAIADGAAASVFGGLWAQRLVQYAVQDVDCDLDQWADWLPLVQKRFMNEFVGQDLPFYLEEPLTTGSFATFLGVVLHPVLPSPEPREPTPDQVGSEADPLSQPVCDFQAVAVGDSCLFQTRGSSLHLRFPLEHSREFSRSPWLVGSRTPTAEVAEQRARRWFGPGLAQDRLWLMTDALACWFLKEVEADREPWKVLEQFFDGPDANARFAAWIDPLRDAKLLHNDDVTLLVIDL